MKPLIIKEWTIKDKNQGIIVVTFVAHLLPQPFALKYMAKHLQNLAGRLFYFTLVTQMPFLFLHLVTDGALDSSDICSPKGEGSAQILILLLVWGFKYTNRFFFLPCQFASRFVSDIFNALCIWINPEIYSSRFLLILLYISKFNLLDLKKKGKRKCEKVF